MKVFLVPWDLPQWRIVYQIYALNGKAFSILTDKAGGLTLIFIDLLHGKK
jgi:hypothetical protein